MQLRVSKEKNKSKSLIFDMLCSMNNLWPASFNIIIKQEYILVLIIKPGPLYIICYLKLTMETFNFNNSNNNSFQKKITEI